MAYTRLKKSGKESKAKKNSLERSALDFLRNNCEDLHFDNEKEELEKERNEYFGNSIGKNQIPYNQQMDIERLCLERALEQFLKSGKKEDAFNVYFCYLEMFVGDYKKTRRMIELLSEYEATGSGLLMKHRDHYVHSVYVFSLGLAIYESNAIYRETYKKFYDITDEKKAAHHYLQYWGLSSLFHDIGYPFELPFEQVCSYFEVHGDERSKRPYVAYQELEIFTQLAKAMQKKIAKIYHLGTDKMITNTDEFFAYVISKKLGNQYYLSEEEMLDVLKNKPKNPNKFNYFMDHAYFSATVLFKKLFVEMDCELNQYSADALSAIILHNSLYKFSIAYYKDKRNNVPFKMELHPLAFMLMLCDELQCWGRTSYGRKSKKEIHPLDCEFDFSDNSIKATYVYDVNEIKIKNFEKEYEQWRAGKKEIKPKLKAYSDMYIKNKNGSSDFLKDILAIVDMEDITLSVDTRLDTKENARKDGYGYLSDSNYINLYNFAVALNGRWLIADDWNKALEKGEEEKFILNLNNTSLFQDAFENLSLEYKISNINQAKAFAKYMDKIGCFFTDRDVDLPMLEFMSEDGKKTQIFTEDEILIIGKLEHQRWIKEHYDMGWEYGDVTLDDTEKEELCKKYEEFGTKEEARELKNKRELLRKHKDLIPDFEFTTDEISVDLVEENYKRIGQKERDKDVSPMECMVTLLKMYDGVKMYRLNTKQDRN